jgi:hypothetical protein
VVPEGPDVVPERTFVEVRNITPDHEVVDLTGIEAAAPTAHRNGSTPHGDGSGTRTQEPEMLPSPDPKA